MPLDCNFTKTLKQLSIITQKEAIYQHETLWVHRFSSREEIGHTYMFVNNNKYVRQYIRYVAVLVGI